MLRFLSWSQRCVKKRSDPTLWKLTRKWSLWRSQWSDVAVTYPCRRITIHLIQALSELRWEVCDVSVVCEKTKCGSVQHGQQTATSTDLWSFLTKLDTITELTTRGRCLLKPVRVLPVRVLPLLWLSLLWVPLQWLPLLWLPLLWIPLLSFGHFGTNYSGCSLSIHNGLIKKLSES